MLCRVHINPNLEKYLLSLGLLVSCFDSGAGKVHNNIVSKTSDDVVRSKHLKGFGLRWYDETRHTFKQNGNTTKAHHTRRVSLTKAPTDMAGYGNNSSSSSNNNNNSEMNKDPKQDLIAGTLLAKATPIADQGPRTCPC